MDLDDELCLCFHVTKRKVLNFLRVHRPRRASQLSECFGAGTGCGWCRKLLVALFEAHQQGRTLEDEPSWEQHRQGRRAYIQSGRGTPPPGATPPSKQQPP